MFFNKVSKIGFAVSIKTEEIIEEKINALPFLNVIIFQKNEKTVFIIIDIYFFLKVIKKTHQKKKTEINRSFRNKNKKKYSQKFSLFI